MKKHASIISYLNGNSRIKRAERTYDMNNLSDEDWWDLAGPDHWWMAQDPKTKEWSKVAPALERDFHAKAMKRNPEWGGNYDGFLQFATGQKGYPTEYGPGKFRAKARNWNSNKQVRKINKILSGYTPSKTDVLRLFMGNRVIPDDETIAQFIKQFGEHANAGHALLYQPRYKGIMPDMELPEGI